MNLVKRQSNRKPSALHCMYESLIYDTLFVGIHLAYYIVYVVCILMNSLGGELVIHHGFDFLLNPTASKQRHLAHTSMFVQTPPE